MYPSDILYPYYYIHIIYPLDMYWIIRYNISKIYYSYIFLIYPLLPPIYPFSFSL